MFACYATNFAYFYNERKNTLDEAIKYGRSKGFEFQIYKNGTLIGYCSGVSLSWYEV